MHLLPVTNIAAIVDVRNISQIDPLTEQPVSIAVKIAKEICDGIDPQHLNHGSQLGALSVAEANGKEEYVSMLIALLPIDLRQVASDGWDRLS